MALISPHPKAGALTELAHTFPTLQGKPGIEMFDPELVWDWAKTREGSAEAFAAIFVLNVWCPPQNDGSWEPWPRFDLMDAMSAWDEPHRAAFLAWARAPWWC